ncbi:unnamed protein product [Symbiodinium natans]|uniref:Uncharacterized protein n=1 Tax=Symbiodinium natans TaxID=878477 RepID=A0A812NB40_9DINO|nr:unnamed protein product [Symbiodinium natans]
MVSPVSFDVFSRCARAFLLPADLLPYLLAARAIDRADPSVSALAVEARVRERLHGWLLPLVQQGMVCPFANSEVRRPHVAWVPFVRDLPDAARRLWNCFAGEIDDLSEFAFHVGVRRTEILAYLNRAHPVAAALREILPYARDLLCLLQVSPFDDRRPLSVPEVDLAGRVLRSSTCSHERMVFFMVHLCFEGYHVVLSFAEESPALHPADEAGTVAPSVDCMLARIPWRPEAAGGVAPSRSASFAMHARFRGPFDVDDLSN